MFSAKTFLFLTFILTIIGAINSTCPESCDDPEDPVCITMIDGTKNNSKTLVNLWSKLAQRIFLVS
uniref:Putative 4.8 kDa secreted salivary gland protein n=1 Tax=Stomoxys calcitrans TaxID=35570 RepID=A5WYF5_STOCA|nr:putative 4.8 kDa secreted salivary gland protein [Stomoxys calcitrans]